MPVYNKITLDNEVLIDLSSDTVSSASHIMSGYVGHLNDGTQVTGTGQGGGGVSRETIVPATTVSATAGNWVQLTSGTTPSFIDGEYYAYTVNGVERIATATLANGTIYLSDVQYDWGGNGFALAYNGSGILFSPSATSGEYTVKVDKLTLSGGGGSSATLITKTITENGTYSASDDDADGYSEVTVNVPSSAQKNVQTVQSTTRRNSTSLGSIASLTCSTAGTYDVYWSCARSNTSQTWGSQLYINGTAYGTENTTWSNHVQNNHLTGVTIPANATVAVYGRSRSGYYIYAPQLTIVQTA